MIDRSKPPICPGECDRCGRLARYWFCDFCLQTPRYVNRMPKPKKTVTVVVCDCHGGLDHVKEQLKAAA